MMSAKCEPFNFGLNGINPEPIVTQAVAIRCHSAMHTTTGILQGNCIYLWQVCVPVRGMWGFSEVDIVVNRYRVMQIV